MKLSAFVVAVLLACSTMSAQPLWKWVVPLKGPTQDEVTALAISPNNTLYATGMFSDSIDLGGLVLPPVGFQYDAFMASFTKTGVPRQATAMGGVFTDESKSVVVDKDGNIYVAGAFIDSIAVAGWIAYALGESSDMFIAKFDKGGGFQWVKSFGSKEYDENSPYLAVDSLGNVYVGGGIGGTGKIQSRTHVSFGKTDAFIAKFNKDGEVIWLTAGGAGDYDNVTSLNVTPNGDRIYAVGFFHGGGNFGDAIPGITAFGSLSDFFVWALTADGKPQWVKRIGSGKNEQNIAGAVDKDGKLLVTGGMFGSTKFDNQSVNANGENESDVFLARFTKTGTIDFVHHWGGVNGEVGTCVLGDKLGGIYIGGYYDSSSVFDDVPLIQYGERDAFIMRCQPDGTMEWVREAGGPHIDEIRGIAVGSDNIPYAAGVFESSADFSGIHIVGDHGIDGFIGALECGPNTRLKPAIATMNICEGQDSSIFATAGYPSYQWYVDGTATVKSARFRMSTLTQGEHIVYVSIRDRYDCTKNSDSVRITVRPGLAKPSITKVGNKLVTDAVATSYQWFHEGVPIPGATTAETPLVGDGLYEVRIADTGGCTRASDAFLQGTTDVADEFGFLGLVVYPNPTNGMLNIQGLTGECEIIIVNNLGIPVYRATHTDERIMLDLSAAPVGAYTVTIRNGYHTTAHRVVRQ